MTTSAHGSSSSSSTNLPPPATLGILCLCSLLFLIQSALGVDLQVLTMCPRLVIYTREWYRIVTSALFHANWMHIGMNMLSMSAIGNMLEKRMGTLRLLFTMWWAMLLTSSLYILMPYLAYAILRYDQLLYSHAVGFSGVLFHLLVLETYLQAGNSSRRSLFGFISVPPALYPWVLLVVLQFVMPNISFLGHLCGILSGNLQYFGLLDKFCLMGESFLMDLEARPFMRKLTTIPGFVPTSQGTSGQYSGDASDVHESIRFVSQTTRKVTGAVGKLLRDVLETILVCIFGRGSRLNENIRFWDRSGRSNDTNTTNSLTMSSLEPNESTIEQDGDTWVEHTTLAAQERESLVSRIV